MLPFSAAVEEVGVVVESDTVVRVPLRRVVKVVGSWLVTTTGLGKEKDAIAAAVNVAAAPLPPVWNPPKKSQ